MLKLKTAQSAYEFLSSESWPSPVLGQGTRRVGDSQSTEKLSNPDGLSKFGLKLLKDDVDFLDRRLPFNRQDRQAALAGYRDAWLREMEREPVEHQKQNAGRREANLWFEETYPSPLRK